MRGGHARLSRALLFNVSSIVLQGTLISSKIAAIQMRLLPDSSLEVFDLLSRLGLSGLSPPFRDIVATAGQDVKKRALLEDLSPELED